MTPEYKAEKEASVSFLGGGGIWEINNVTLVAPAAALLWSILQSRQGSFKSDSLQAYIVDFLLHCGAILFGITVYSDSPQALNGLLILPAIAALLQPSGKATASVPATDKALSSNGKPNDSTTTTTATQTELNPLPVKPFITTYRGAMMIITCISILAVDFPVFPRRFAKTEAFGTSLMDLGVGSFVFAAGIVAARQQLKDRASRSPPSLFSRFKTALRHSAPLFTLGFLRLASIKNLDYVEHVSEYGVHWNFFFTLALLPPTLALLQPLLNYIPMYGLVAFIIGIAYESALYMSPTLKTYIILSERIPGNFLSQNREGVYSYIGYFAIFLAGMGSGMNILPRDPGDTPPPTLGEQKADLLDEDADWLAAVLEPGVEHASTSNEPPPLGRPEMPDNTLGRLAVLTAFWFVACVWAMWHYGPRLFVSRRMANLAYICWVCAFNNGQLLLFCGIERVMFPKLYTSSNSAEEKERVEEATSRVMKAFNRNGLALFLLANLLTGAVNLACETWRMGEVGAMCVLGGYVGVLATVGVLLDRYDISVKL